MPMSTVNYLPVQRCESNFMNLAHLLRVTLKILLRNFICDCDFTEMSIRTTEKGNEQGKFIIVNVSCTLLSQLFDGRRLARNLAQITCGISA